MSVCFGGELYGIKTLKRLIVSFQLKKQSNFSVESCPAFFFSLENMVAITFISPFNFSALVLSAPAR